MYVQIILCYRTPFQYEIDGVTQRTRAAYNTGIGMVILVFFKGHPVAKKKKKTKTKPTTTTITASEIN
jgi:hypothetical protein